MSVKPLQEWLMAYSVSHQNKVNKWIHRVCVPVIFISIYAILFAIPTPSSFPVIVNWANLVYILALIFWFRLNILVGIAFLIVGVLVALGVMFYWVVFCFALKMVLFKVALVAFILAWIGQFIGHHIEGKKPSFLDDLKFLLIGPIWIVYSIKK